MGGDRGLVPMLADAGGGDAAKMGTWYCSTSAPGCRRMSFLSPRERPVDCWAGCQAYPPEEQLSYM
jgi:hypothetical protein